MDELHGTQSFAKRQRPDAAVTQSQFGDLVKKVVAEFDVLPHLSSASVSSPIPHEKEIGREEAFYRRADHWLPAGS